MRLRTCGVQVARNTEDIRCLGRLGVQDIPPPYSGTQTSDTEDLNRPGKGLEVISALRHLSGETSKSRGPLLWALVLGRYILEKDLKYGSLCCRSLVTAPQWLYKDSEIG